MILDKLLFFGIFMIAESSATTFCSVDAVSGCTYTVTCVLHAGTASNVNCAGLEPNVTFVIINSTANELTTAFFGATNFDSKVRYIEAHDNSWTTLGKHSFRYYSICVTINLSNNKIQDIQDETFKTLMMLENLNISHNKLKNLHSGSFKISDSKSGSLETLDLSFNYLTYLTDDVLAELPNLITLYLNGNNLKSLSDNCFGGLKLLNFLFIQNNELRTLNLTLVNVKNLTYLDMSFNYLDSLIDYQINRLQNVEFINASNNIIDVVESNCFAQSPKLRIIDLSFNLIKSNIDNNMFQNNIELEYLNLYRNDINIIEDDSFKFCNISYLNLQKNKISGPITSKTFTGLKHLVKLDLSQQNITMLKNNSFENMASLSYFNLSRNNIDIIENSSFVNSSISILDLSFNNISTLFFMKGNLVNLTEFYMNNNKITCITTNVFEKQTFLKKIDLSFNKIKTVEPKAFLFINLQYLNLINNSIEGDITANMFSPAKYLRFLDLSNQNIKNINETSLTDMPVLARLNLSHNAIERVHSDNFKNMNNMFSLDLSHNNLKKLHFNNSLLTNLKSVYLNNNNLTDISGVFTETCKLLYLDLSHNGLHNFTNGSATIFPDLQVLHLSHNIIENFNNNDTNTLITLVDLHLSSNKITNINLSFFKELLTVDLSYNKISSINSSFFENIDFLQSLDLSHNKLIDLAPGTFQTMRNLKLVNLSSNFIWRLRYGSLKGLHKTESLDLSNNRIQSLDVHVFHECTELKTLIIDYNRITTLDIERLVLVTQRKLKTLSLGGNPISCHEIIKNTTIKTLSYYGINQLEITSIHKIYHEDNVHGIKCGDSDEVTTTEVVTKMAPQIHSSTTAIVVWCTVLTFVVVAAGLFVFFRLKKQNDVIAIFRDSRMQLRSSVNLSESDQQDFLS